MALTDTEIKKTKPKEKAYRMSDSGGMYFWVATSGGNLLRWGSDLTAKKSSWPWASIRRYLWRWPGNAMVRPESCCARDRPDGTAESRQDCRAGCQREFLRQDSTRCRLSANILPTLGARPIAEIEAPEVVPMVRLIEARRARDIAKRASETTGQIFRYGIAHGYAKRNHAAEIRPRDILKGSPKINFSRIDAKELPHLLKQIEIYQGSIS